MATQYVQLANDHSGQSLPHLDLNWPTTGVDIAKTALGQGLSSTLPPYHPISVLAPMALAVTFVFSVYEVARG